MDAEANAARRLGNHSARLESVVDALDRILLHGDEKTGRELGVRRTGVEEGGACVREETLAHEVVRLDGALDIVTVDPNGDAHEHVLRTLCDTAVDPE